MSRTFAISDIHGCLAQFKSLIEKLKLKPEDTLILMGDYIDRGLDSKGVLDYIIQLKSKYNVIVLLGNHDAMMREVFRGETDEAREWAKVVWMNNGGRSTLQSYNLYIDVLWSEETPEELEEHLDFIEEMPLYYTTDTHIFVHSTPDPTKDLEDLSERELVWRRPSAEDKSGFYKHKSGKFVVCGHTAQETGTPTLLSDHLAMIDTGCFFTGTLTAMEIQDNQEFKFHSAT